MPPLTPEERVEDIVLRYQRSYGRRDGIVWLKNEIRKVYQEAYNRGLEDAAKLLEKASMLRPGYTATIESFAEAIRFLKNSGGQKS